MTTPKDTPLDEIPVDQDVDVDVDVDDDDDSTENDPLLKPTPAPQKPADPYAGSHAMGRLDPEWSGLPKRGPKTDETSFIEGEPSGRVWTSENSKIYLANLDLQQQYPQYGKNGKFLDLLVETVKTKWGETEEVFVRGPRKGSKPKRLYTAKKNN